MWAACWLVRHAVTHKVTDSIPVSHDRKLYSNSVNYFWLDGHNSRRAIWLVYKSVNYAILYETTSMTPTMSLSRVRCPFSWLRTLSTHMANYVVMLIHTIIHSFWLDQLFGRVCLSKKTIFWDMDAGLVAGIVYEVSYLLAISFPTYTTTKVIFLYESPWFLQTDHN